MSKEVEQVTNALWNAFVVATKSHPRGVFFRMHDEAIHTKMILMAIATVMAPMLLEVERLRRKVG